MEEAADVLAQRVHEKGLELVLALDPSLPPAVRGDADRVRQILVNLIGNAVKFTREGEVVVKAIAVAVGGNRVRFEVQDTGIGIDPSHLRFIFDAFTQADGSITRRHAGTGLGLAICQQLVELMDGEIGAESTPGSGSLFWLEILLPSAQPPESQGALEPEELHGKRILILDDNATLRQILHERVTAWG